VVEEGPKASRLRLPAGYRAPAEGVPMLAWSWARGRLEQASTYWLATADRMAKPHVAPLWGVWVEDALYFDGFSSARWARNLASNSAASVHLESGTDVVIVDGHVDDTVPPALTAEGVVTDWKGKYARMIPEPSRGVYRLTPRIARAWTRFPDDATTWAFS
jgi:Pyridoxamine 5'-phosphate oxidase